MSHEIKATPAARGFDEVPINDYSNEKHALDKADGTEVAVVEGDDANAQAAKEA